MKKPLIFVSLTLMFLILFCGCSKNSDEKSYTLFEKPLVVSFAEGETKVSGSFDFASSQEMSLTLLSPEEAKGYTIALKDGELLLNIDGISYSLENLKNIFGTAKGIETLFEIFSAAGAEDMKFTKQHQKIEYSLGEAVVSFDESGKLNSIRAGNYDFYFTADTSNA